MSANAGLHLALLRAMKSQDGRPVYIEQLGGIDLTAMYKITTGERMLLNLAVEYERLADPRLPACSRKAGHLLETCCTIMDLKGVGLSKASQVYSYVKQASGISQNYYPERLGRFYLINAPWGFSTVWAVVKSWLDPVTVAKIHILAVATRRRSCSSRSPRRTCPASSAASVTVRVAAASATWAPGGTPSGLAPPGGRRRTARSSRAPRLR